MTSRAVRSHFTSGTRKSASSRVFSPSSDSAAASSLRSISMATDRASVSTTSIGRRRRMAGNRRSAMAAAKRMEARSRAKRSRTPGRNTLTATVCAFSPSPMRALCTCAIEAAAIAGPNSLNSLSIGMSKEASMVRTASSRGKGGSRSCRVSRSAAARTPTTSGRVARNWPNLT